MKTSSIAVLLLSSLLVLSCGMFDGPSNQKEETVNVAIKLNGLELTETLEPITRAGESVIYFFSVHQDGKPYAWYCMNSFNDVSISLVKDHTYEFIGYVAYNIVGDYYWFNNVGNGISYLGRSTTNGFEYTDATEYSLRYPLRNYEYKMLVCSESFYSVPESIVLNMYNAFWGLKANAINLDGTLEILLGKESGNSFAYDLSVLLTKDQPSVTKYIHFLHPLTVVSAASSGEEYTKDVDVTIKYTDADNNTSILHSGQITASRMKYTVLNITMNGNLDNPSSCVLRIEEENLTDGVTVNLEY